MHMAMAGILWTKVSAPSPHPDRRHDIVSTRLPLVPCAYVSSTSRALLVRLSGRQTVLPIRRQHHADARYQVALDVLQGHMILRDHNLPHIELDHHYNFSMDRW